MSDRSNGVKAGRRSEGPPMAELENGPGRANDRETMPYRMSSARPEPEGPARSQANPSDSRSLRRRDVLAGGLLAGGSVLLPPGLSRAQDTVFFRIGTGSTGGTYFPIGGIIASAISSPPGLPSCEVGGSCGVPGLIAVAQASSGSVENIGDIVSGALESGLSQADIAFWAYTGTELYEFLGPQTSLRAIAHLYGELVHVVVREGSDCLTVADLRGKRVSTGAEGSGTLINARAILDAYGVGLDEIEEVHLNPEASADAIVEDALDAFFFVGGAPVLVIEDLSQRVPIRLLPFADEVADTIVAEMPFFTNALVPPDAYTTLLPVPTLAVGALWVTHERVDEDLIYGITEALWHRVTGALLVEGHARGQDIRLQNALQGVPIPIHDGAAAFYRDAGILPAEEVPESE